MAWKTYLGVDLAKVNDFTSIVALRVNERETPSHIIAATYLMKSVKYTTQAEIVGDLIIAWDPLGVGVDETAHRSFPDMLQGVLERRNADRADDEQIDVSVVHGKSFSWKFITDRTEELRELVDTDDIAFFTEMTFTLDANEQWVQEDREWIIDDLCSVVQGQTAGGKPRYEVPTPKSKDEGHADSYSATLLALGEARGSGISIAGAST